MNKFREKLGGYFNSIFRTTADQDTQESSRWSTGIFHSARLKLTGYYLLVLVVLSLVLTLTFMGLARYNFDHANQGDRGIVRQLINNYY